MSGDTRRRLARKSATLRVAAAVLVVLTVALGLLWLVGRTIDRNRTAASDSQLVADLQVARATLQSDVAVALRKASALAHMPRVEEALARNDAAALRAIAAAHPDVFLISSGGARAGSLAPLGVRRILPVVSGGRTLGRVVTDAPLGASFIARAQASLPSHNLLAVTQGGRVAHGAPAAGVDLTADSARTVRARGHAYRALGSELVRDRPDLRIVALAPAGTRFLAAWRLPLASLATLCVAGLLVLFAAGGLRRQERRRPVRHVVAEPAQQRAPQEAPMSLAMLGEQLAATKDVDALLRVILDAAIKATGAVGGKVAQPGVALAPDGDVLRVPLHTNDPDGDPALLLYPPPAGFSSEATGIAHWLGTHAGTAIRDARFHRVVQDQETIDVLTGLANRKQFTTTLEREFSRCERQALPLSVVLGDLDDFKAVNDRLGVRAGDEVLKEFAATIRRCAREIDLVARISGEEFAVVMPETDTEGATRFAERLRAEFAAAERLPAAVTASYGIASYPRAGSAEELLTIADACLRRAKHDGKDRVVAPVASMRTAART
jgi:diguanylate cyclase (GGDEF)-like protein